MAYFRDDENQDQNENQGNGVATSQQSGTIDSGSGAPQGNQANTPDKGSNFVGLKSYLNANKNQAQKLGDQTAGVISNSAQDARTGLNSLNDTFNQQAGGPVQNNQLALGKLNQAESLNDQEKADLKKQYNAQYTGPNSLMDLQDQYNQVGQKINKAQTNVNSAGTEEGRKNLITQVNEKPRTQGVTNFDSLLLQTGGGREKVGAAADQNKDLNSELLNQNNISAQQKAADIKTQNDSIRNQTQSAVSGANQSLSQSLAQRLKEMQGNIVNQNNSIMNDLGDNAYGLNQENLDRYGITAGTNSYGLNPIDYFKQGDAGAVNTSNVAKAEEYARAQALAQIAGGESLLDPANVSQADTASQYMGGVDKQKFLSDLAKRKGDYVGSYGVEGYSGQPSVTNPNFINSVVPFDRLDNGGRGYVDLLTGKSTQQLMDEVLPRIEAGARGQFHDPTLTQSGPGILATNLRKYLDQMRAGQGQTFSKN